MGFKEDADFARYLTMGAYGTEAVRQDLIERHGHRVIELERYALANKVWAIKVKRLRMPDLLCVHCGQRIESKAKSQLVIKLSHSETPDREWFAGGMRDDDLFAFVRVRLTSEGPEIGRPSYLSRAGLEAVVDHAKAGVRKALSEGSEADLTWKSWVPSSAGTFVGTDSDGYLVYRVEGADRDRRYGHHRKWSQHHVHLKPGDTFTAGDTIVAAIAPAGEVACSGATWDWVAALDDSSDAITRFAAVKAARELGAERVENQLLAMLGDDECDWRLRLEVAGALASVANAEGLQYLGEVLGDAELPEEQTMEAILIVSELNDRPGAAELLHQLAADVDRVEELRSAAVWGLGTGPAAHPDRIVRLLDDANDRVALHAAGALTTLSKAAKGHLTGWLRTGNARQAAVAAAVLARHHSLDELVDAAGDETAAGRLYALRALGDLAEADVRAAVTVPSALEERLETLWLQHEDWLQRPENLGAIDILHEQRVRFEVSGRTH